MTEDNNAGASKPAESAIASGRVLTPAAHRALAEAQTRRVEAADEAAQAREYNGRGGLEPVRFGDWEVKGIATDF